MKLNKLAMAVGLALALPTVSHADPTFNFGGDSFTFNGLDWTQTSFLAQNGVTAIGTGVGATFNVFSSGTLNSFQFNGTNLTTGVGSAYEVTYVAGFQETITVAGNPASFQAVPNTGFLAIYVSSTINADPLTGNGFDDGTQILYAQISNPATGFFSVVNTTPVPLDNFLAAGQNYTGQNTVSGIGVQQSLVFNVLGQYLPIISNANLISLNFANQAPETPFSTIDPMACYDATAPANVANAGGAGVRQCDFTHVNGLFSAQTANGGNTGYLANIGTVNGNGEAPDFVAQVDPNSTIRSTSVPEPGRLGAVGRSTLRGRWSVAPQEQESLTRNVEAT